MPATDENLSALTTLSGNWIERANKRRKMKELVLDMDSAASLPSQRARRMGSRRVPHTTVTSGGPATTLCSA